jgi:thiol-disulfide isomerase/thioredoxin
LALRRYPDGMIKNNVVRLTVALTALASSAMAGDFAGPTPDLDQLAHSARSLAALQIMCPIDSPPSSSFISLPGTIAPDFTLNDTSGKPVTLSSLRGKVVLLDFWASWCPPCQASTPFLQELENQYGSKGLVVLGVNQGESHDKVKDFMTTRGLTYKVVLDESRSLQGPYRVRGIPAFVIVGTDGSIVWRQTGYTPDMQSAFKAVIEKALAASGKTPSI